MARLKGKSIRDRFVVGQDIQAVSRASITMNGAARALRDSSRAMAKAFLTPDQSSSDVRLPLGPATDPWGFEEAPVETWADILGPQYLDLALLTAFIALALQLQAQERAAQVPDLCRGDRLHGIRQELPDLDHQHLQHRRLELAGREIQPRVVLFFGFTVVSTILWGRLYCGRVCAYGALTQTLDAVLPARWRVDVPRSIEQRAAWIKFGILFGVLAYYIVTHDVLIYQYVEPFWMFGLFGHDDAVDAAGGAADRDRVRPQPVLPVPVPGRRHARPAVVSDRVPHQALVGVQHLPHLPEGVPVGRDRRPEDPGDRVRALRRLRAPVRRHHEVSALADHRLPTNRKVHPL